MSTEQEWAEFDAYVESNSLKVNRLILTHGHIDHVMGCQGIFERFALLPECHPESVVVLAANERVAEMYGVPFVAGPDPKKFISEQDSISFDGQELEIRYVPGHAPGHLVFVDHEARRVIAGDTLFNGSIGRTDLPGGNHNVLLEKIKTELYTLADDYVVYCGHGPTTTIGKEKKTNPFVKA